MTTSETQPPTDTPAPDGYRWATCSQALSPVTSRNRHLVRRGSKDTACGHSATHVDIWRKNTSKPPCAPCLTHLERLTS